MFMSQLSLRIVFATTAWLSASPGSSAASFDCASAKSRVERAICGSPSLSEADARMAVAYARAEKALAPASADALKLAQRRWLQFRNQVCGVDTADDDAHLRDAQACLEHETKDRTSALGSVGLKVGPYVLDRVDLYDVKPAAPGDTSGWFTGHVVHRVSYPRLEGRLSPGAVAWNAAHVKELSQASSQEGDSDIQIGFAVGCAGERWLSLLFSDAEYAHGTPHGIFGGTTETTFVAPQVKTLAPEDLFGHGQDWRSRLPALFWKAYLRKDGAVSDVPSIQDAVRGAAVMPDKWLLTPAGVEVDFDAYEGGCHACNPGPVSVPWAEIRPLLTSPDFGHCQATTGSP
jgi:uncharacterized protein YecT (DUF1311 family)